MSEVTFSLDQVRSDAHSPFPFSSDEGFCIAMSLVSFRVSPHGIAELGLDAWSYDDD